MGVVKVHAVNFLNCLEMPGIVCFLFLALLVCGSESFSLSSELTRTDEMRPKKPSLGEVPPGTSDCKCVNSTCQNVSEYDRKLLAMLEKLLMFVRHRVVHRRHLGQELKRMASEVQTYVRAKSCDCINSKCYCVHKQEGKESSPVVKELVESLYQKNDEILAEEAELQQTVRRFH